MMRSGIVERAQQGDRRAFGMLAAEVIDRLYGAAVLIVRDAAIAEDAVQETLLRAWRGITRLRDPDRVDAWLNRILLNACMDAIRDARRDTTAFEEASWGGAEDGFERIVDMRDEVGRGLAALQPRDRGTLVMRYFLGLSVPELADVLGVPLGTAKSRLHHALEAMHAELAANNRVAVPGGLM